jgi:hypothetical protein
MSFDALVSRPPFSLAQAEKERLLLSAMNDLMRYHVEHSAEYARIIDAMWGGRQAAKTIADVPFLPVSIFKRTDLVSTREKTMLLTSSGTTGQRPSRIYVDSETSARQSRALVATLKPILGNKRLPFLIIDTRKVISDPTLLTARGAAVLGLMKFGGKATFALDVELEVDKEAIRNFLASHGARPFLIFGFTLRSLRAGRTRSVQRHPHPFWRMEDHGKSEGRQSGIPDKAVQEVRSETSLQLLRNGGTDRFHFP